MFKKYEKYRYKYILKNPNWNEPKVFNTYKEMQRYYMHLSLEDSMKCSWDYIV